MRPILSHLYRSCCVNREWELPVLFLSPPLPIGFSCIYFCCCCTNKGSLKCCLIPCYSLKGHTFSNASYLKFISLYVMITARKKKKSGHGIFASVNMNNKTDDSQENTFCYSSHILLLWFW